MDLKMAFSIKEMTLALSNIQINEKTSQKTIKHTQTEKKQSYKQKGEQNMVQGLQRHELICTDSGCGKIFWMDKDGNITRELVVGAACYDVWALPNGNVLYPFFSDKDSGVRIVTPEGKELFSYHTTGEVFGCQPLENGNILTGELIQKRLCEVNTNGEIVKEIPVIYEGTPHEAMRMPRKVKDGYLLVQPGLCKIAKYDPDGNFVRYYDTYHDTFGVVQRDNGNLIYTYMDGMVELDPSGREIWHLRDEDVPGMNIRWLLGLQLLHNGNIVVTNWMGHGHNEEGIPFFEVTPDKKVVWYCDCRKYTALPAVAQILDETEDRATVCYRPTK